MKMMIKRWIQVSLVAVAVMGTEVEAKKDERSPNVILFLIDDLSWADLSLTGSKFYETPNIDRLAAEGGFFDNAYAANPVCSPTRASVLTGKYPSRLGISNHSGSRGPKGPKYMLTAPEVEAAIPHSDTTLAEALKSQGYATAHIGKWHLAKHTAKDRSDYPEKHGFDLNIAGHKMGQPGSFHFPYKSKKHPSTNVPDLEDGQDGDYLTDVLTRKAIEFIEAKQDEPFFLNLWYYTVHTPIIPKKEKLKKYQNKLKKMGMTSKAVGVPVKQSISRAQQNSPAYACMVESMDENIGRIIDRVKELGLEDDTLVVFLSDNGGLSTGAGPNAPTSSFPLRAGKAWVYEGGIRSPLIVKLPGKVKPGVVHHEPAVSTDVYPTVLELAGIDLLPKQHLDGVSLAGLLGGTMKELEREAIYIHYPHYHHINSMGPAGAVRVGDYKLVEIYETGELELYNLSKDLGEEENLAKQMPELSAKMAKMLDQWRKETKSAMPTKTQGYREGNDWRRKKK